MRSRWGFVIHSYAFAISSYQNATFQRINTRFKEICCDFYAQRFNTGFRYENYGNFLKAVLR